MSRIARKLCDEIVESPLNSLRYGDLPISSLSKCVSQFSNENSTRPKKATRSVLVEKKRQIINIPSNDLSKSRTKFTNEQTLLNKSYVNRAVNTLISRTLRCDTDCVTAVRKRDYKCSCKCGNKCLSSKSSVKQVQTFGKPIFSDKACTQCVETSTCGTQFQEKLGSEANSQNKTKCGIMKYTQDNKQPVLTQISDLLRPGDLRYSNLRNSDLRRPHWKDSTVTDSNWIKPDQGNSALGHLDIGNSELRYLGLRKSGLRNSNFKETGFGHAHINDFDRSTIYNYMGARRWALSQYYPSKGPDF